MGGGIGDRVRVYACVYVHVHVRVCTSPKQASPLLASAPASMTTLPGLDPDETGGAVGGALAWSPPSRGSSASSTGAACVCMCELNIVCWVCNECICVSVSVSVSVCVCVCVCA